MFDYIQETKTEFKHVKWPTRRQAILYTIVVILFSAATAILLGAFDFIFTKIIKLFI